MLKALLSATALAGSAPEKILLLRHGVNQNADGGNSKFKLLDATAVINASLLHQTKAVIDYDHQVDINIMGRKGGRAPAAGWIRELSSDDEGVWGHIEWTEAGAKSITSKEYRYISPVINHDKDGNVIRILRASLTNIPQLELKALNSQASKTHHNKDETMDMQEFFKALLSVLKLQPDAKTELALQEIKQLCAKSKEAEMLSKAVTTLSGPLKLKSNAPIDDIVKACLARFEEGGGGGNKDSVTGDDLKDDPKDEIIKGLLARLNALEDSHNSDKAEACVDAAIKGGRLTPAMRDWGISYCTKDPKGFSEMVGKSPQIAGDGKTILQGVPADGKAALTSEQKAMCAQTGVPEADFLKSLNAEAS